MKYLAFGFVILAALLPGPVCAQLRAPATLVARANIRPVSDVSMDKGCVILLHGLARTKGSMAKLAEHLQADGFAVQNIGYPSRKYTIKQLATMTIPLAVSQCQNVLRKHGRSVDAIHFVSHSMGGILVRYYFKFLVDSKSAGIMASVKAGRVVMLGPPNHGSEVVDKLKGVPGFRWLNGPAGLELGTDVDSMPNQLGAATFELGVIAGSRSINLVLSGLIPGADDGKVAVANTRLAGMQDHLVLPVTHPFLMKSDAAITQVKSFLKTGYFSH